MFSKGQLVFAIIFIVLFVGGMIYAYRKDIAKNKAYFKGTYKILLVFLVIYLAYFLLNRIL